MRCLAVGLFVLGSLAVTVVGKLGWHGMSAFCLTFLPGLVLGWTFSVRRFRGVRVRLPRWR